MINKETIYTKDEANNKIKVVREFDAPLEQVWKAWTERELLDQWWAPKPWQAHTQSINVKPGGEWRYYMEGPDGARHYCRVDYENVTPNRSFTGTDAFCDENGNLSQDMPSMHWDAKFSSAGNSTKVEVDITFSSIDDLNKIVEMGFQEGFAAAHKNLDEVLAGGKH